MTAVPHAEGVLLEIDGRRMGVTLRAPHPGCFLRRHPSRRTDLARPGQVLGAGAILCLIAAGPILVPIVMPEPGLVLCFRSAPGAATGHGDPVADYVSLADLAALGLAP
jgi:hypothetical protein